MEDLQEVGDQGPQPGRVALRIENYKEKWNPSVCIPSEEMPDPSSHKANHLSYPLKLPHV